MGRLPHARTLQNCWRQKKKEESKEECMGPLEGTGRFLRRGEAGGPLGERGRDARGGYPIRGDFLFREPNENRPSIDGRGRGGEREEARG